jgi:lysophospholipase L1-like esterase
MDYLGEQPSIEELVSEKAGKLDQGDWWVPAASRLLGLNPRVVTGVAYVLAGVAMGWAVWKQGLVVGVVAGLVALMALFVAHDEFHHYCTGNRSLSWRMVGWGLLACEVGGAFIVLFGIEGSAIATLVGTWIALVGLAAVVAGSRSLSSPLDPKGNTLYWVLGGVALAMASLYVATRWPHNDAVIGLSVLGGILGLIIIMVGFRWMCYVEDRIWSAVGLTLSSVAVIAFIGVAWLSVEPVGWLIGFGAILVLGLIPLSMAVPPLAKSWSYFRWGVLVALGAAVGALLTLEFAGEMSFGQVLIVFIFCLLIAAGIVFEGLELVPVLVFGVAIAIVVTDRVDRTDTSPVAVIVEDATNDQQTTASKTLVAIGDSYISGEGADRYFKGTNVIGENECRRASTAYPHGVAAELGWNLESYACSGARTSNVLTSAQQKSAPDDIPQIEHLKRLLRTDSPDEPVEIGAVLISIGGNDAWFGAIAQACIAPGDCDKHRTTVLRNVKGIGDDILEVYREVRELVDPVPVIAIAYPLIFADTSCDESPVSQKELEFLLELTEVLNDRAHKSARQAGIHFYSASVDAFEGERICETAKGDAVVNVAHFNPQEGRLLERLNPTNWVHGSAHPKPAGHERIVLPLSRYLDALDGKGNLVPDPLAIFEIVLESQDKRVSTRLLGIPNDFACGSGDLPVSAVATVIDVNQVEQPYSRAKPGSPVCYSLPDGGWSEGELTVDDGGLASVPVLEPESGYRQVVVWQSLQRDTWHVSVLEFCELDPECAADAEAVQAWTSDQIAEKAASLAAPFAIIFLGAWLLVVEVKRERYRRAAAGRD